MPGQIIAGVGSTDPQKSQPISYVEPLFFFSNAGADANPIPASFSLPSGLYRFVLSGCGAQSSGGSAGGAAGVCVATRRLSSSDVLVASVVTSGTPGGVTTLTFPDGTIMSAITGTAPGTSIGTAGGATGGDINLTGSGPTPPVYNGISGTGYGAFNPSAGYPSLLIFKLG